MLRFAAQTLAVQTVVPSGRGSWIHEQGGDFPEFGVPPHRRAASSGHKHDDLHREPFLTAVVLTAGGVYDNRGLETAWKRYDTILVSNGGGRMSPDEEPKGDWI